jgi:hypothetical protein
MRAREFIFEKSQQVDEIAPFVAALGGALARGAATVGGAAARGAVQGAASAAGNLAKSAGTQAVTTIGNKLIGQNKPASTVTTGTQQPINIPSGTKIEPVAPTAGSNPNQFKVKIGGAELTLDLKDPKNSQILQQLNQLKTPSV